MSNKFRISSYASAFDGAKNAFDGTKKVAIDYSQIQKEVFQKLYAAELAAPVVVGEPHEVPTEKGSATSKEIFPRYRSKEYLVFYPRSQRADDYSENTVNPGEMVYTNIKSLLARFFITIHSSYGKMYNWREFCIGVISANVSTAGKELHMPMFDYDGKNIKTHVRKQVKVLQEEHGLGDAWVYKTKRGLHVYFFTDLVDRNEYLDMLRDSECCKGFRRATENHGYGTLRISAKFTKFDISLEYILRSKKRYARRMTRKAHLVQELIRMGQECGTHFASLFPQWAYFQEDPSEWKQGPPNKRKKARNIEEVKYGAKYRDKAVKVDCASYKNASNVIIDKEQNIVIDSPALWSNTTATTTYVPSYKSAFDK